METALNNNSNNYLAQYEGEIVYGLGGDDYLVADGSKWAGDDFFFPTPLTLGGALDDPFDSDQWSPVVLYGGDGNDTLQSLNPPGGAVLNGGSGNDKIFGSAGAELIDGGEDNDTIWTMLGNDDVRAGSGDDTVYVNASSGDKLQGE